MNNIHERKLDVLKLIKGLDITPTMYKNAVEKYHNLTDYLERNGIKADIYPQGSFALGTIIRPLAKDPDAYYDLDFICQLPVSKDRTTAEKSWNTVKNILEKSDLYGGKLTVFENCFTIEYAETNGVGFKIDIVPAVDESIAEKVVLKGLSGKPELIETAIAIPKEERQSFSWITNNPKGYKSWFEDINEPFKNENRKARRAMIFEEAKAIYNSVEEIPEGLERSSMQRVIQILKYHKSVYYSKRPDGDQLEPISAIINTIVAKISDHAPSNFDTFDLLQYVLSEIATYSQHQILTEKRFSELYGLKEVIQRKGGQWIIANPANPKDNLADAWNHNDKIAPTFFRWAQTVTEDLIDSLQREDAMFRSRVEGALGESYVKRVWDKKYNSIPATIIAPESQRKPWKRI